MIDYITIRNFYPDPYAIRDYAFEQEYHRREQSLEVNGVESNFPGWRTKKDVGIKTEFVLNKIQQVLEPVHGKIVKWENPWNGLLQYCTHRDRAWIHTDVPGTWAGVLFLTPK